MLVVSEGKNSEPIYLSALRRMFSANAIELVACGEGKGDPRALTDKALALKKKRRAKARKRELSISQLEDFDEIWIVFDTDAIPSDLRDDGIEYARSHDVRVASSEPCFEYWLLLHAVGGYTTSYFPNCDSVIPQLKTIFGWSSYGKNRSECEALLPPLAKREPVTTAIKAAERVRRYHADSGTSFPANPSTDLDQLVLAINGAVPRVSRLQL
jgi:hypothetical protein